MESEKIAEVIRGYMKMRVSGVVTSCPYWSNKISSGVVTDRGFANGKGSAHEIEKELNRLCVDYQNAHPADSITRDVIERIAGEHKTGIDCSGFVYRVLSSILRMDDCFPGVNRTNAHMLTSSLVQSVARAKNLKPLDLIRANGGRHVMIVIGVADDTIDYAHSSSTTTPRGVHVSDIRLISPMSGLKDQIWREKTRNGGSWKDEFFDPEKGDGVYRIKVKMKK